MCLFFHKILLTFTIHLMQCNRRKCVYQRVSLVVPHSDPAHINFKNTFEIVQWFFFFETFAFILILKRFVSRKNYILLYIRAKVYLLLILRRSLNLTPEQQQLFTARIQFTDEILLAFIWAINKTCTHTAAAAANPERQNESKKMKQINAEWRKKNIDN